MHLFTYSCSYFYRLLSGPESLSIFEKGQAWHVPEELNLTEMQVGSCILPVKYVFPGHNCFWM